MAVAYEQLRALLPEEKRLNVDETGHTEKGQPWWTWCFRAALYTLFKIERSRGSDVLVAMLGEEFNGVLGCDYFSAYHKYMGDWDVAVQFCLAHLIRDVKFLTDLPDPVTAAYGQRVLPGLRQLFHVIHRRETMAPARFQRALEQARDELLAVGKRAPQRREAQNMAERFRRAWGGLLPVHHHAGDRADQQSGRAGHSLRGDRPAGDAGHTQRTRAAVGRTHLDGHRDLHAASDEACSNYLYQSIVAYFTRRPAPSLLPAGP